MGYCNWADTFVSSSDMETSIGSQPPSTFRAILAEIERLASIRPNLSQRDGEVDAIGEVILKKIKIMQGISVTGSEIEILDDLDRLVSLRSKLWDDSGRLRGEREAPPTIEGHLAHGMVLDWCIKNHLDALKSYKTVESFEKGISAIERLVKMAPGLDGFGDDQVHSLIMSRIESLSLPIEKRVSSSFYKPPFASNRAKSDQPVDSNSPEHSEAGINTPDDTEKVYPTCHTV